MNSISMRLRKITLAVAATIALVVAAPLAASAATGTVHAPAAATPLSATSNFNFCNETGGKIACFSARLVFHNRNTFTLSDIELKDTSRDHRSVLALVAWQSGNEKKGELAGRPYTWKNSEGYGSTLRPGNLTIAVSKGVRYVMIWLWAANLNGNSKAQPSAQHDNPFWKS
jgi:hypothetical protein